MFNTSQFNQIEFNQSYIHRVLGYLKIKTVNRTNTMAGNRLRMKIYNHR